jgi:DNA-binding transcriptional MerR regulator
MSETHRGKAPSAFRTITEAGDELGVPAHVLRFWEGKFPALRPMKRAGGRRLYRVDDMALLRGLKTLLHDDGYTIKGVQKLLKDNGVAWVREAGGASGEFEEELSPRPMPIARTSQERAADGPAASREQERQVIEDDARSTVSPSRAAIALSPSDQRRLQEALSRLHAARVRIGRALSAA